MVKSLMNHSNTMPQNWREIDEPLWKIRAERGLLRKIALDLGISAAAVSLWRRVPAERALDVERITGIPRTELRPDLYPR